MNRYRRCIGVARTHRTFVRAELRSPASTFAQRASRKKTPGRFPCRAFSSSDAAIGYRRAARCRIIPTRLSIGRLEPCGGGVSARSRVDDTVSDTENPAWHLRALSRPHRRIHALSVSKIAGIRASGQFASAIPSLIPSGSFRCDSRYRLSPALDDNTNASDLTREHHQPTAHLATHP